MAATAMRPIEKKPTTDFPARAYVFRRCRYAADLPDVSNSFADVPSKLELARKRNNGKPIAAQNLTA
jgi:hypothetical protein